MSECLMNGIGLSAQNLGALPMKVKIYRPYVANQYITIIHIVLRFGTSEVYIILISSFSRYRGLGAQGEQIVRISSTHRTADPTVETLCAGAHSQSRSG